MFFFVFMRVERVHVGKLLKCCSFRSTATDVSESDVFDLFFGLHEIKKKMQAVQGAHVFLFFLCA